MQKVLHVKAHTHVPSWPGRAKTAAPSPRIKSALNCQSISSPQQQVNCKARDSSRVHQLQSQNLVKFIQGLFIWIENHRIFFVVFHVNWKPYNSIHLPQCELKIIKFYSTGQVYSGFIHMNWKWSSMWIENHIIPLIIFNGNWKSHNFIHLLQCEWKN